VDELTNYLLVMFAITELITLVFMLGLVVMLQRKIRRLERRTHAALAQLEKDFVRYT
jgi:hypothetical protein